MSSAPKGPGFFQTIPGLITATAGLLSAATGAIVALNQTGVIDLKQMAAKTAVTPAAVQSPADVPEGKESGPLQAATTSSAVPVTQPEPEAPAIESERARVPAEMPKPSVQEAAASPVDSAPPPSEQKVSEASPEPHPTTPAETAPPVEKQAGAVVPPPAVSEAERLAAIQEGAAAAARQPKAVEPRPAPHSPATTVAPPTHSPDPIAKPGDSREGQSESPPPGTMPPSTQPGALPRTGAAQLPSPGDETIVRAPVPSQPGPRQPGSPPVAGGQVADARSSRRPAVPIESDNPRVVRAPADGARAPDVASGTGRQEGRVDRSMVPREMASGGGRSLNLTGIQFTIPSGWVREDVQPGPMAPVAAFRIPDPSGDGLVQISRHMGAKGNDFEEKAIERWIGLVSRGGGSATRGDARIERFQVGPIRITTVDLGGTVKRSARDAGEADQRIVGAIIDHPAGPHLVRITGPARGMANWDPAIDAFLRSARTN